MVAGQRDTRLFGHDGEDEDEDQERRELQREALPWLSFETYHIILWMIVPSLDLY